MRFAAARTRRGLLAVLVTAAVAVPVTAAGGAPPVPAPAPPRLPAVGPAALDARYDANRAYIAEAARTAARHGYPSRARALRAMAAPGRRFLAFDARGDGRAVEVVGDLAAARRVAVLVPGVDTGLDTFDRHGTPYAAPGGGARALRDELRRQDPRAAVAVVAWLGYDTPGTFGPAALTTGRADDGARELRTFAASLHRAFPRARVSALCHSYGSVVCGRAAHGLAAADIAVYGSPGLGVRRAADLRTRARVWAGRAGGDWVDAVPGVRVRLPGTTLGFGPDPVSPGFGARVFPAGGGGHGDYLRPGSLPLRELAGIVLGRRGGPGGGSGA
ncbi:alpha/beta hydrolase family protein [Streptomyces capparidis]